MAAMLGGCGGGGDGSAAAGTAGVVQTGGGEAHVVTFTPSSVRIVTVAGRTDHFTIKAAVSGETDTETGPVLAALLVDKPVLEQAPVSFTIDDNDNAILHPRLVPLGAGQYDATVTLKLCQDARCVSEIPLERNSFPLSITVLPRLQLTAEGLPEQASGDYTVKSGVPVVVTSNVPVNWSTRNLVGMAGFQTISSTPTRLEAVLVAGPGTIATISATGTDQLTDPMALPNYRDILFRIPF